MNPLLVKLNLRPIIASVPVFLLGSSRGEAVVVLVMALILTGYQHLGGFKRLMGRGISEFLKASGQIGIETGQIIGWDFGKPAGEALTLINQTFELDDPAELRYGALNLKRELEQWQAGRTKKALGRFLVGLAAVTLIGSAIVAIVGK